MQFVIIFSIISIVLIHSLLIACREEGNLKYETSYDMFTLLMYITIFANLAVLFKWWSLIITIFLFIAGHKFLYPSSSLIKKFDLIPDSLLTLFFVFSWVNLALTIGHFGLIILG
jgi:hypothetical protein